MTKYELIQARKDMDQIEKDSWIDWGGGVACGVLGFLVLGPAIEMLSNGEVVAGMALIALPLVGLFGVAARSLYKMRNQVKEIVDHISFSAVLNKSGSNSGLKK